MKLKKHGALLVNFVIDFANGDMSREANEQYESAESVTVDLAKLEEALSFFKVRI